MSETLAKGLQRWYPIIVLIGSGLISIGASRATAAFMQLQVTQNTHDILLLRDSIASDKTTLARIEERIIAIQARLDRREGRDAK